MPVASRRPVLIVWQGGWKGIDKIPFGVADGADATLTSPIDSPARRPPFLRVAKVNQMQFSTLAQVE